MTEQHPITPPPELVKQWKRTAPHQSNEHEHYHYITLCAAQWGADQELDACCEWLDNVGDLKQQLRTARRPKPPSLKEQALEAAQRFYANGHDGCNEDEVKDDFDIIRRALEQLDD